MKTMKDVEVQLQKFLCEFLGFKVYARHEGSHFRVYSYENNQEWFLPVKVVVGKLEELGF